MTKGKARDLAKKIADALFTNGAGETAKRLVLELEEKRTGGGWCRSAVIDSIEEVLLKNGVKR